jgi:glycosyltransferase involved in cell wall biosynthesis
MNNKIIYLASKFHGFNVVIDRMIELLINILMCRKNAWKNYYQSYYASYNNFKPSQKFIDDPARFLTNMAIVLKSPSETEKGVLLIAYNYAFPTFSLLFDTKEVLKKYHLVLEPSTARFFMSDILMFKGLSEKVYIQAGEPRDAQLLKRISTNLHPLPIAANWWINSNIFKPNPEVIKDIDIIMVSSWLKLKRHNLLFKALSQLKQRGQMLRCALVGYPIDMTKEDIITLAKKHGVLEQIELHEWLSQEEIALLYQRSKLNLLLSKREGFNRSIIEGFHCDIPCLLREGFNFGYKYDYMNNQTGGYYKDNYLADIINSTISNIDSYKPQQWLYDNGMTAQAATLIMEEEIYGKISNTIVSKVSGLDGMTYWNNSDVNKFEPDYEYLMTLINKIPNI